MSTCVLTSSSFRDVLLTPLTHALTIQRNINYVDKVVDVFFLCLAMSTSMHCTSLLTTIMLLAKPIATTKLITQQLVSIATTRSARSYEYIVLTKQRGTGEYITCILVPCICILNTSQNPFGGLAKDSVIPFFVFQRQGCMQASAEELMQCEQM